MEETLGRKTNVPSVVSVTFASAGLIIPIIPSIIGFVAGIAGVAKSRRSLGIGLTPSIIGICLSMIGGSAWTVAICAFFVLQYESTRPKGLDIPEVRSRVLCASQMRQIYAGLQIYANDNRGKYPQTLWWITSPDLISTEVHYCHGVKNDDDYFDAKARMYKYVGSGFNVGSSSASVLLYEPLGNHENDGSNILFNDGQVFFVPLAEAKSIQDDIQSGNNDSPNIFRIWQTLDEKQKRLNAKYGN